MLQKKQLTAALLTALLLTSVSCGSAPAPVSTDGTTAQQGGETAEPGYDYPNVNYGGYEFRILNPDVSQSYECYVSLAFDEQTGEMLDDAVYARNMRVEEKLGCKIVDMQTVCESGWTKQQVGLIDLLSNSVLAGDDAYDAAYLPVYFKPGVITDGYLVNLYDVPTMHLDADYWDHDVNDALAINNKLFIASGPLHLQSFDLTWILLFNEDLMTNMKLEYPYQLVRDGKWTMDKFGEYLTAAANLNGDDSWTFSDDGKAFYGVAAHSTFINAQMFGAGFRYTVNDKSGTPQLNLDSELFYNALDKMSKLYSNQNGHFNFNQTANTPGYYYQAFSDERSLFLTSEIKGTLVLRTMNDTFGLVPVPKYDEDQEKYYSLVTSSTPFLTIPNTNTNLERTGVILDALNYESAKTVLPTYFDVSVSQKGLRNEDSIEMLEIVREGRSLDFCPIYGINSEINTAVPEIIRDQKGTAASVIASNRSSTETKLANILKLFNELD